MRAIHPNTVKCYYPFGMLTKTTNFKFGSFRSPEKHDSGLIKERAFAGNSYRFGFGGQEKDDEVSGEGNSYTAEYWQYDSRLGRRFNIDNRPITGLSVYACFANNPLFFIDPHGDTTKINSFGIILEKQINKDNSLKDNLVYMQNDEGKLEFLGELGGKIKADKFYSNMLKSNSKRADKIWNPMDFEKLVKADGEWDLKSQQDHIIGLAHSLQTSGIIGFSLFLFDNKELNPGDIGNHHYGVVGKALGLIGEKGLLYQAGVAERKKSIRTTGHDVPLSQRPTKTITYERDRFDGGNSNSVVTILLWPYGDSPRDSNWINEGFKYYNSNRSELDGDWW